MRFVLVAAVAVTAASAQPALSPTDRCATGAEPSARTVEALFVDGRFDPFVVRSGLDETVLTLTVSDPAVVEIAWPTFYTTQAGVPVDSLVLRDDGAGADAAAGDGVFSAAPARLTYDGSFGPATGFFNGYRRARVTYADGRTERASVVLPLSLGILTDAVPIVRPQRGDLGAGLGAGIDRTDHLVATVGAFDDVEGATATLLGLVPLEPDFVHIAAPHPDPLETAAGQFLHVKAEIGGIGLGTVDRSADFGATGALRGVVQTYPFPNPGLLNHELGHYWFAFLDPALDLNRGSHWAATERPSTGFGSPTWGAYPALTPAAGDTVRAALLPRDGHYNDLELYLMGLVGPDAVASPIRALRDADQVGIEAGTYVFVADGVREVTMDEIVAAEGPRQPAVGQSPTAFSMATHVVYDRPLTDVEFSYFDYTLRAYEQASASGAGLSFEAATGGRATLTTRMFSTGVAVEDEPTRRPRLTLAGANPVRDVVRFRLADVPGDASLAIVDVLGRRVVALPSGPTVLWDASGAAPGVYLAVLRHPGGTATLRFTVAR